MNSAQKPSGFATKKDRVVGPMKTGPPVALKVVSPADFMRGITISTSLDINKMWAVPGS